MSLAKYSKKRDFSKTPEPSAAPAFKKTKHLEFVVQEHHATALHYDFRLEIDGVLKSWAVPKGPSLDPHEHHLAIMTEDHPYEYRKFEGVIPEGNYGAGNVIIWDKGWYEARQGKSVDSEKTLRSELKKGHITFVLHGKKLKGEFALIKMPHQGEKNWLLIKKGDKFASSTQNIIAQDESVVSHKRVDDLPGSRKLPDLSIYPKKATPWQVKPMLCTLVEEPFSRDGWFFEIKWDGYRAIGSKKASDIKLYSRNNLDFVERYPPIAEALRSFKHDVILDGEIVVVDQDGTPRFEWLQNWRRENQGSLGYYIFDILWCDGRDLREAPLAERKKILKAILPKNSNLHFSDDIPTEGIHLFNEMKKRSLEGMVAKRADSPYREGERGMDWLKVKTHLRQEVVIGGYTEPRGGRKYLGALVVGVYKKGEFIYVGHSGGGIADKQRKELFEKLQKLEQKSAPFTTEPKTNAPAHWVKPTIVCEMSFSEWTKEGYMRQPKFEGLRPDKKPQDVKREKAKDIIPLKTNKTSPVEFTHLDKVFFPKHKYTKGDLVEYYESIADYILPYLKDRACSMLRMPDGINGMDFFQKNNEHLPDWVPRADIFSESNNANLHWVVGGKLDTLFYMVQLGCVEINPWSSKIGQLNKPDWMVIDLDPEGTITFKDVIKVAKVVKEVCDEWNIPTHPKTSGKSGLHIYVPMGAKYDYDQVKNLAHLIVLEVNRRQPDITSVERMPDKRKNKIYLDFLQNREGQTLAAPYSVRPTPDASVSMPLDWGEVVPSLKPSDFTIKNALRRLNRVGDLWKPVLGKGVNIGAIIKKIESKNN